MVRRPQVHDQDVILGRRDVIQPPSAAYSFFKALARKLQCPAVLRDRAHDVIRGSRRHLGFDLESHRDLRS